MRKLIPIPGYLLELDSGERIVIDTGMHPAHIDDPDHTFRDMPIAEILRPVMGPEDLLEYRLGQLRLGLGDVTHVFNTHLHFDHCGQNFLFTDVPILVHKAHYEAALIRPAFPNENFDLPDLHYELFEGDLVELFPGVTTITTQGHAPYHQSLLIELPNSRPILLAVDAIYTRPTSSRGRGGRRPIRSPPRPAAKCSPPSRATAAPCSSSATTRSSGPSCATPRRASMTETLALVWSCRGIAHRAAVAVWPGQFFVARFIGVERLHGSEKCRAPVRIASRGKRKACRGNRAPVESRW